MLGDGLERGSLGAMYSCELTSSVMAGGWVSLPSCCSLSSYAPWCPACKQFARTWEEFGTWAEETAEVKVGVGKVDVTAQTCELLTFCVASLLSVSLTM